MPPPRERIDFRDWEFPTEDLMVFEGEQTVSIASTLVHEEDADVIVGTIDLATFDITDKVIKEQGGEEIQKELHRWLEFNGAVPTGDAILSESGNFKCKYILHVAGEFTKS